MSFLPRMSREDFESIGFTFTLENAPCLPAFSRSQLLYVLEFFVAQAIASAQCSLCSLPHAAALVRACVRDLSDHEFHVIFGNVLSFTAVSDVVIAKTIWTCPDRLLVACLLLGNGDITRLTALKREYILMNMFHR